MDHSLGMCMLQPESGEANHLAGSRCGQWPTSIHEPVEADAIDAFHH